MSRSIDIVAYPSPNHGERPSGQPVEHLVLHYTELDLETSLAVLTDVARPGRVSSHYVLAEDGTVYALVDEPRAAWHAGRSHWRGAVGLNASSIGIEIVNLHGDRHDYPERQIEALIALCRGILVRHAAIVPRNVVGHSDIAPKRKVDPGLRFPWRRLAGEGIGLWPRRPDGTAMPDSGDAAPKTTAGAVDAATAAALLQRFGYAPPHTYPDADGKAVAVTAEDIVATFQRRFRPWRADGVADAETLERLHDLLRQVCELPPLTPPRPATS